MRQTRKLTIDYRNFSLDDLKRIAEVFENQVKLSKRSEHYYYVNYRIEFSDDITLTSETSSILNDSMIETKKPIQVEFEFHNRELDRKMSIQLTHGSSSKWSNYFSITSNEAAWVNDNYTKIESCVNGASPQSFWCLHHPIFFSILLLLGAGCLTSSILYIFKVHITFTSTSLPSNAHFYSIILGVIWGFGIIHFQKWFLSSWPRIELDFGAEHLRMEKKRRVIIVSIVTLFVIPIIIIVAYDIIKSYLLT